MFLWTFRRLKSVHATMTALRECSREGSQTNRRFRSSKSQIDTLTLHLILKSHALLPSNRMNGINHRIDIPLLDGNPMLPIPLNHRRRLRITIHMQQLPMQMQSRISQTMNMNRRNLQNMRTHTLELMALGRPAHIRARGMATVLAERNQRRPPREQHPKLIIRIRLPVPLQSNLLIIQQARRDFRALAEPDDPDPGSRPRVALLARLDRVHQLLPSRGVVDSRVFGFPSQPAAEGAVVLVDGDDPGSGVAEEGAVREDEAEVGEVPDESAGLHAEDFGGDAAAVEAEDPGFVEVR